MKIIARNLPVNVHYKLIDKTYAGKDSCDYQPCANCGKLIKNICTVQSVNGTYEIGTECCERLTGINPDEILEAKRVFNQIKRAIKKIQEQVSKNKLVVEIGKYRTFVMSGSKKSFGNILYNIENEYFNKHLKRYVPDDLIVYETE